MKVKNVSFTIPLMLADSLSKERNKSKVVTDALSQYYAQKTRERINKTSWDEEFSLTNTIARKIRAKKLSASDIVKYKNRGRK